MKKKIEAYVYIIASKSGTLYGEATNDIHCKVYEHKIGFNEGFTKKDHCHKLVYVEYTDYFVGAIEREKQVKHWNRKKKENLIRIQNPSWKDLVSSCFSERLLHSGRSGARDRGRNEVRGAALI